MNVPSLSPQMTVRARMLRGLGRVLVGAIGATGGAFLVATTLWAVGASTEAAKVASGPTKTSFSLPEVKKPPPKQRQRRRKPKARKNRRRQAKAVAAVAVGLTGPSFGASMGLDELGAQDGFSELLGDTGDVVMTEDTVDTAPRARNRTPPTYPARARKEAVEGEVELNLLIDAEGKVVDVRVLQSRPQGVFDQAATQAVRSWRFQPARYRGQPVRAWARQRMKFELE